MTNILIYTNVFLLIFNYKLFHILIFNFYNRKILFQDNNTIYKITTQYNKNYLIIIYTEIIFLFLNIFLDFG